MKARIVIACLPALACMALAHDIWVEPSATVVRAGDWVRLSLMLGNHGNQHRDFRLASKVAPGDQNLVVHAPGGKTYDITSSLVDEGYEPKEGYWSARFQASDPGLYMAASSFDKVMSYAPVRDVKSAKTFFVVSKSMDKVPMANPGYDKVLGHALELVPVTNPVTPMGPGTPLRVRLLFNGKPLAGAKVSFIPKGVELKGDTDPTYEKLTGADGDVEFEMRQANTYLVAAHYHDGAAKGEGYTGINYGATMVVLVPAICPCCGSG